MFVDIMPESVFPCGRCRKVGDAENGYFIRQYDDGGIRLECRQCGGCCPTMYGEDAKELVEYWMQVRDSLGRLSTLIRAVKDRKEQQKQERNHG